MVLIAVNRQHLQYPVSQTGFGMSSRLGSRQKKSFIMVSALGAHRVQDLSCSKQSHTTNLAVGTGQLEIQHNNPIITAR